MKFRGKEITELLAFNRRNFIKLMVGGAAGIHLSPLPWKLTDDIAIWTQNWSWVPVPPEGRFTHEKSVCTLCPGGCGIEVRKVDERAVKVEGRTDYPVNPGGICPLGMGGLQLIYNEAIRFTSPMKRMGARGSGEFKSISWDEAIGELAERINDMRQQGRPGALAAVDGNPMRSTMSAAIERLLKAVGSPNYMRVPFSEDTSQMVNTLMQGTEGPMAYDLENADFILSFGSGLLEGWGSPGRVINAWRIWRPSPPSKGGARIVQVESRASNTASKADQWVPAQPGTETALALGIAHVIIKEGLYDPDFINKHTYGFHDWSSSDGVKHRGFRHMVLNQYAPANVEKITGVDSNIIVRLARNFAKSKAPLAICGKGKGGLNGSLYEFMAVHALNALVGNINRPGGVLVHDPIPLGQLSGIKLDDIAEAGLMKSRIDLAGSRLYPFSHSLLNNFTDTIRRSRKSIIDTLLVFSSNPIFTLPDGGDFKRAMMAKVPFIVSFSPYRDETAYMADLILPDHTYLEKMDDVVWPTGLQYPLYGLTKPVVEPIYTTRNSGDVIIQLAKRIGGSVKNSFPWKDYEEVLKVRFQGLFESGAGMTGYDDSLPPWKRMKETAELIPDDTTFDKMWEKVKTEGLWYRPAHRFKNWDKIFKTPTGKFEFFSSRIEMAAKEANLSDLGIKVKGDEAFMPHYEPVTPKVEKGAYPLLLVPYELFNLSSGWLPSPPYLNKTLFDNQLRKDESFAEINPKTAADYELKEGDRVVIESPKGKVRARVHVFDGAMPDVVYMPLGLGHNAYDDFLRGKGANPNYIISEERDPLSGHPVWWNTPVKVTKVLR